MKSFICTHESPEGAIYQYGKGPTFEHAKSEFFAEIEADSDYKEGDEIKWELFKEVPLIEFLKSNCRHLYLDGILEDLFDECAFDDIWPEKEEADKLESMLIGTIKNWVDSQEKWMNMWQCGDLLERGVYVKQAKEQEG